MSGAQWEWIGAGLRVIHLINRNDLRGEHTAMLLSLCGEHSVLYDRNHQIRGRRKKLCSNCIAAFAKLERST